MKKLTQAAQEALDAEPEIDVEALSREAALDDESPVIVTSRFLRQVERELRAARMIRAEAARAIGMQTFIAGITAAGTDQGTFQ